MGDIKAWMPLYIGDYLGDTIDLTNAEHGAYLRAIMSYWRKGESLTHRELRAICGKEIDRVCLFFVGCDGRWHHKRVDEELARARANQKAAHDKAVKGVEARRQSGQLPPKKNLSG